METTGNDIGSADGSISNPNETAQNTSGAANDARRSPVDWLDMAQRMVMSQLILSRGA